MTDTISQKGIGSVGAVLPVGKPPGKQKFLHLLPVYQQHGADDLSADRGDGAQPFQTGAADHAHDHRLGVVVGGVGGGDFPVQTPKKGIPGIPGGGFQPLFSRTNLHRTHMQGDVIASAEFPDKGFIPVGFFPTEMVVKMGGFQTDVQLILQQIQCKQERHGIRPAGDGADDRISRRHHIILPDHPQELIPHVSTPGRQRSDTGRSTAF